MSAVTEALIWNSTHVPRMPRVMRDFLTALSCLNHVFIASLLILSCTLAFWAFLSTRSRPSRLVPKS